MLAVSLDTLGLYARSADDLELLCDAFRLQDDTTPDIKPISAMKIGICKSPAWTQETVNPSLEKVWAQAQDLLKAAGAELVELDLSPDFDGLFDVARTVMWCEARSAFLSDYLNLPELCHDDFKEHATNGKGLTRKEQLAAYDRLSRLKPVWDEIADRYDVSFGSFRYGTDADCSTGCSYTERDWRSSREPGHYRIRYVGSLSGCNN